MILTFLNSLFQDGFFLGPISTYFEEKNSFAFASDVYLQLQLQLHFCFAFFIIETLKTCAERI